jgi:uncharacterized coiled-coil protein SlyX
MEHIMTDKNQNVPNGDDNQDGNAPSDLEQKVAELETKLNNQNEAAKRTADAKTKLESELADTQKKLKELESAQPSKEDTDRIADLEMRLARSEAVAEFGLDAEDVAIFRGTPDEIKEQAAHFASKLAPNQGANNNNTSDGDTPPEGDTPPDPPKPKKKELTNLERFKRASAVERREMLERAQKGEIDLAK